MLWLKNFWLFLTWFGIILYLSFTPLQNWPKIGTFEKLQLDQVVHIIMYGILCLLLLRGIFMQNHRTKPSLQAIISSIVFCALVGISIEFLQPILTMYRQFEIADMI